MPVSKYDFSAFEEDLKPKEKAPKEEAYDFSAFEEDVKKKETPSAIESKPQPSKPFPTLESFGIDNRSFYTSAPKESTGVNKNIVTPEVEAQVETRKKNVQIAIDNTTGRALKNKGIKAPKNSPAYNAQRKKVEEAVKNGDAVYSVDPNTNTPALSQSTGFFESFWNGMMAASKAEEEANDFANMTTKERVEFANRKMVSTEEGYMGEAPSGMSSKIYSTIGEAVPFLLKMGAGAAAGAGLVAAAPETMGASLAGLPAAMSLAFTTPDMVKQGGMSEVLTRYNMLKTQNPNMSDEALMEEANKGYTAGGIVGGATNLAFGAVGGEAAKPLQQEAKNVLGGILKETIKGTAKSAATLGVVTGAGELAKGIERGIENKALRQSAQKNIDVAVDGLLGGATTGIILHMATSIATGAVKAPGLVKSGIKYALSKENPVELASVLKANEQLGNIPEGTTETVMSDIVDYNNALAKTSQDLSPETQASVAGLIQKRDKLVNEMSQLDPTQVDAYTQQVEALNEQIKNITNTGNPFEFELNQVGQRLSEAKLPEPSKELEAIENNRKLDLQELKDKGLESREYKKQVKEIDDYYNNLKQQYDKENITRVSSEVGVGEKPVEAQPVEVGGTQETGSGGVLQENVPSGEGKVAEVTQGEVDAQKADIEKRRQADLNNEEFLKYPGKELTTFSEDDYRKMRIDDINAKYDAELNALEEKQKTEAPVPTKAEVTQGEVDALKDVDSTAKALEGEISGKTIAEIKSKIPLSSEYDLTNPAEVSQAYHADKASGIETKLTKAVEDLLGKKEEAPVPSEKAQGIEGVEQEVTIEKMKPFTDRMVEIEREFKNNEYEIDTDYDNEIQVLDKNGEQVEPSELPKNLSSLAADYEKATSKLGEFDASAREKALAESRKVVEAEAEVVEPKKEDFPPVQEKQEPIVKIEKPTINKDNKGQEPFVTRNKKQMVKINQNGTAIVTDMQGNPVSRAIEKKALREYARKFDYSIGKKAEESGNEISSARDIIIESENPLEVAEIYANEELATANMSSVEAMIHDYGIGKVTNKSFRRYNDVNNITMSLAKSYLSKEGRGLDQIAKDMSDHYFPEGDGTEISPEDVGDFMVRFPNRESGRLMETDIAKEAAQKFKQLTGLYLNREIADIAVNQQFELLNKEQQKLLEYEYKNQSELEKDYWNTYAKTDGFTKEIPVGEAKQAKAAPRKKVGNFEAKAQKIADKIMATELPSWFSIADKDVVTKGIDAEGMKRLLADAVVNMGKLLDSGVEFSEALKQSVKELVGIKGEENRESIEKGFEEYYKAQVPLEENPFENIPRTQVARDKYFESTFGENADRAREIYNQGGTPAEMLSKMETPIDKDKLGGEIRGITMKDNAERREAIGMEERKPNPSSVEQWRAEAQKRIAEGYNIDNLIEKMERGDLIDEVDNEITRIFMATLDAEVMKNPSNENIAKSMQLIKLSENAGSKQGSILRSRQGLSNPLEKISDFYVAEMESLNVGELTETQKKKIQQQFDGIQAAKEEYRKKYEEAQAKFAEMQAQDELLKQKRELKAKSSSEAKDYVAERQSLKEKLRQAVEKYKNNANKMGIASDGGAENFAITVEMAKIISQIAKSHVEEVGAKLVEVTRRTLDDVKDLFDGITDKDIRDIIAGKYSERKETKSELAANLRQLKAEAGLLNELDRVIAGEPKTEKARIEKNQRLAEIRRQINEVKKNNGLEEYSAESRIEKATEAAEKNIKELEDKIAANDLDVKNAEKINSPELEVLRNKQKKLRDELEAKRKEAGAGQYSEEARAKKAIEANKRRQKEIEERIANNDFDAPKKRESIYESGDFKRNNPTLYNELLDSQVKAHEAELEFHKKLVENEMASMGKMDKFKLVMKKAGGTLRAFFAGIDDSAIGVQNWFRAVRNPVIGTRAIRDHVLDFWSQKRFDRNLTELYNSPDYKAMKESGLQISNPKSLLEEGKEELFPTRFRAIIKLNGKEYGWMNIGGKKYELLDVLKPFERAFTSLGNSLRVISFRTAAAKLESKGITFEKNPEEYKKLATRINAQTSASQPNKAFQSEILNLGVWSPRLMTSKLNLLGVSDLASYTPLVKQGYYRSLGEKGKVLSRQQLYAAYDLAQFAASIVAGSYLYAAARGGDVNTNPFDDRFMDVELPNGKSYNFTGGFSKYIAALFQITSGGKVDRKTGLYKEYSGFKDRGSEVLHFMRGKMPPISGSVVNLAVGKDYTGNETSLSSEAEKYKMPMAIAQISRQLENDGYSSLFGDGIPTFLGISVKDKRDYRSPNSLFDPNVDLQLPEFKILIEKGVEIPELGNREKYKVDKNVKHPDEVMTPEEFDIFKGLVSMYMKGGFTDKETDAKVIGIKDILNANYSVETYGKEGEIEKEAYVTGKDLTKEQLESKINELKSKSIQKAKEEMMLVEKKGKTVVKFDWLD